MMRYKDEEFNFKDHNDSGPEPDYLIDVPKNDYRAKMTEIYVEKTGWNEPYTMVFCPREVWGALPPKDDVPPRPLNHPVKWVSLPETHTEYCMDPDECVDIIRQMQKDHMNAGLRDIKYNFMVSNEGIIYEGRGWHEEADRDPGTNEELPGNCIDIGLIGDRKDQFQLKVFPAPAIAKAALAWMTYGQGDKEYIMKDPWYQCPDWNEFTVVYPTVKE